MNAKNQWNSRYATDDYVFGMAPNRFLTEQAWRLPLAAEVLAVADGEGRNGVWLAQQGHNVTSVDIAEEGLAKARKLAAERGVEIDFQLTDLASWHWPQAGYDAVVAIFIQFAGPELRQQMFDGMKQAVRPGGLILLQGYRPEQLAYGTGGPPCADNMYSVAWLRATFADWDIVHLAVHDSEICEGAGHGGMSALIDLVVRRVL